MSRNLQDTDALVLFDNKKEESLLKTIISIMGMSADERKKMERDALLFYEENCTEQIFANNYIKIINDIKESL